VDVTDERLVHDFDFQLVTSEDLPFASGSFDVVVSNHVIEHVLQAPAHLREIRRVLREDGVAYLATPNKWTIMEPHFKLPGLSWLPKHLADRYVRLVGRGERYDVDLLTYRQLAALATGAGLRVVDKSNALVTRRIQRLIGVRQRVTDHLRPLFPSFVVLLRPEAGDCPGTRIL
jgi:SAM-dependent methyltransferase